MFLWHLAWQVMNLLNLKNLKKFINKLAKKPWFFMAVAFVVAVVVYVGLLYANAGFLNISGFFERHDMYKDSIVLFSHDECSYCANVDTYLKNNKVALKVEFIQLDVFASDYNRNELLERAKDCGMDEADVGVPFLWDGPDKKCIIGYVDIIDFFRQKLKKP